MKIKILTVSFALILLGTGVVDANDLYAYRYVREDGKVLNTTDTEYTELERITSQGKELATVAFMGENQDKDTMRFKLKVKLSGNFHPDQIYKIIAVSKDKDGTITEIEQLVPRALYGRITTPKFSITQDGDPHKIYGKRGRLILVNNAVHIRPANMDTNLDLIKAGIISHERRVPVTNEKRGTSWWVNPMIQNRDIMYRGESIILKFPLGEDGKFRRMRVMNSFKKNSNIHVWAVGRNQVNRDKSINSIYFLYGRERTRYFTFGIFNENIEPIYNDSGFHTADGKKDMFGLGISKTKSFANGWYVDALCQYAFFNRDIYTVNEGVYGRQHASMRGQDIGLSLEVGRKIQIHPNWSVQPEVQYTYHMYHQNAYRDSLEREFGDKNIRDREIRAGIKVQYKWIYAKVNRYFRNSTGAKAHIDTEKEIGIERCINKDYTLRAFWSSYSYPYIRVKSNKKPVVYKNQQNQFWAVGRNQVNRDKSINSIYFLYGRERTRYFTFGICNENIEPIYNDSGFHTADGKMDMFGLGISKTKSFTNGWYGDALCQYAFFNRDIYTVNDGVYGRQYASMRGQDIGLSLEVGRKIQIHPNWLVQSEVQYTYHMYHQNAYKDSLEREFGDKNIRDREIRAGIKVQYKWIYAKVNRYFRNSTGAKAHIDTEKEIGIERRINKDYTLRAFWSSYSYPYIRVKSNKKTVVYKNQQNQFSLMLQKYF